ncbi:MAG: hypothetical protein ACE5EL_08935, partial [Anaerolineae bacterium]
VNLYDRRIYRFDTASGALLGSFAHGAAGEAWAADARPFGLGFHDGRLYHGVVNSAETRKDPADLEAIVYESAPDGTAMRQVARFGLGYDRGTVQIPGVLGQAPQAVPLDWQPWAEGELDLMKGKAQTALFPQPILTDIVFGADGDMIVGIRDRFGDQSLAFQRRIGGKIEKPGIGLGDILRLPANGTTWDPPAEYDRYPMPGSSAERGAMGGLAQVDAFDITLADRVRFAGNPAFGTFNVQEGALWYDADGNPLRQELVCVTRLYRAVPTKAPDAGDGELARIPAGGPRGLARAPGGGPPGPARAPPPQPAHSEWVPGKGMGDVEVLCGPPPTPTPTATPGPTASPSPTATATREPT